MAAACPEQTGADSGATDSELPAYIVLDDEAYMEDLENATTAVGKTRSGHRRVKVSFFAADPPRLSHFCVHCPGLTTKFDFQGRPRVLHAEGNLALISIGFACGSTTEYFFYRAAGCGRRPSIEPLPKIVGKYLAGQSFVASVGFRPCGGDGGGYVVAALALTLVAEESELHVFRSERGTRTKTVLVHGRHLLCMVEKVIAMGAGELGFVSLLKGIIVCDVLSDNPTGRFVPLPKLLPANKDHNELCSARPFRDVAGYADGLIKCVEVEPLSRITIHKVPRATKKRIIPVKLPDDVSNEDELHDSDLIPDPVDVEEVDMVEEETYEYLGWRVIVWSRMPFSTSWRKECLDKLEEETYEYLGWRVIVWSRMPSSTSWRKECLIHVDDIIANTTPTRAALLGEVGGSSAPSLSTLKELHVSYPSLSIDDSNALYLTTKVKPSSWGEPSRSIRVIKVNMDTKTLEGISPVLAERERYNLNYISCDLSKYLNTDSDATPIGGQNDDSCSASSSLLSGLTTSDDRPPARYYGGYYCTPSTPASCPYFGNGLKYQLQPLMPPTAHPHPPPPPPPQSSNQNIDED